MHAATWPFEYSDHAVAQKPVYVVVPPPPPPPLEGTPATGGGGGDEMTGVTGPLPPPPPPELELPPGPGTSQPVAPVKPAGLIATSAQFQKASGYASRELAVMYVHCKTHRSQLMPAGTCSTIVYVETVVVDTVEENSTT